MLSAVVFDFDGVLVDTEPFHYEAFKEAFTPVGLGLSWEKYLSDYVGYDDRGAIQEAFRAAGREVQQETMEDLIRAKARAFRLIVERQGVVAYPGACELVHALHGRLPLALCSGALREDIEPILPRIGLQGMFDAVVTADDVRQSKPDPESYRLAVARLAELQGHPAIVPAACLAIEDTPTGIESASAAGLAVLAVANSYPTADLATARACVESLVGMDLDQLATLMPG